MVYIFKEIFNIKMINFVNMYRMLFCYIKYLGELLYSVMMVDNIEFIFIF